MEFVLPDPGDSGQPQTRTGAVGGSATWQTHRLVRDGAQVLAHGALICPSCALPVAPSGQLPIAHEVRCGFCDHAGPAAAYVREDVYDTVANEVYVVARIV